MLNMYDMYMYAVYEYVYAIYAIHINIYVYIYMVYNVYMCDMYVCMCICVSVYVCVFVCMCMCAYVYHNLYAFCLFTDIFCILYSKGSTALIFPFFPFTVQYGTVGTLYSYSTFFLFFITSFTVPQVR